MKQGLLTLLLLIMLGVTAVTVNADSIALEQTVQAGAAGHVTLEMSNDTAVSHDYTLSLSGYPDGVTMQFVQDGTSADRVTLLPNNKSRIEIAIAVGAVTPVGRYTGQIDASRDDGASLTMPLVLNVANTYALQIISQTLNMTTFSGGEFTFNVSGMNTGAAAVTHAVLSLDLPARWIAQIDPQTSAQIDPGTQVDYSVHIIVPSTQAALDQPLTFALTSDQAVSADASLLVRVQDNPNFLPIAAGVGLLAILAVFFYFRTQGRR